MKIYKVKVNGKVYEVELESVTESAQKITAEPKPQPQQATQTVASGVQLKAPMQGVILDIKVNVGDTVRKGQTLFILEAMKLENDIVSPADGVVKQIAVTKDQNVNNQQLLAVIE
ncbi:MAG TPA: biotin/lipoyl-containing protein [Bacilli bacterium]